MPIRSLVRRALPALVAAVVAVPAALHAQPITYTFSGITDLFGGSHSYQLSLTSDASSVLDLSSGFGLSAGTFLLNPALGGSVSLDGSPTMPLATVAGSLSFAVGALNNAPFLPAGFNTGVGVLAVDMSTFDLFGLYMPTMAGPYDLATSVGPVTGQSIVFAGSLATSGFPIDLYAAAPFGTTTFTATTAVTATPEPASLALMATGLVMLGGAVARRRRQTA